MSPSDHVTRLLAATACSGDGRVIGPVTAVYLDEDTGRPSWVGVRPGQADDTGDPVDPEHPVDAEHLVPLARAWLHPGPRLVVPVTRRAVEQAPVPPGPELDVEDEDELYRYYAQAISPTVRDGRPLAGAGRVRLRRLAGPGVRCLSAAT